MICAPNGHSQRVVIFNITGQHDLRAGIFLRGLGAVTVLFRLMVDGCGLGHMRLQASFAFSQRPFSAARLAAITVLGMPRMVSGIMQKAHGCSTVL